MTQLSVIIQDIFMAEFNKKIGEIEKSIGRALIFGMLALPVAGAPTNQENTPPQSLTLRTQVPPRELQPHESGIAEGHGYMAQAFDLQAREIAPASAEATKSTESGDIDLPEDASNIRITTQADGKQVVSYLTPDGMTIKYPDGRIVLVPGVTNFAVNEKAMPTKGNPSGINFVAERPFAEDYILVTFDGDLTNLPQIIGRGRYQKLSMVKNGDVMVVVSSHEPEEKYTDGNSRVYVTVKKDGDWRYYLYPVDNFRVNPKATDIAINGKGGVGIVITEDTDRAFVQMAQITDINGDASLQINGFPMELANVQGAKVHEPHVSVDAQGLIRLIYWQDNGKYMATAVYPNGSMGDFVLGDEADMLSHAYDITSLLNGFTVGEFMSRVNGQAMSFEMIDDTVKKVTAPTYGLTGRAEELMAHNFGWGMSKATVVASGADGKKARTIDTHEFASNFVPGMSR